MCQAYMLHLSFMPSSLPHRAAVASMQIRQSRRDGSQCSTCTGDDLLIDEDEAEHGPAEAPLIGAVLEQHYFKERRQQRRQQLWPLLQVLRHFLHRRLTLSALHLLARMMAQPAAVFYACGGETTGRKKVEDQAFQAMHPCVLRTHSPQSAVRLCISGCLQCRK